MLRWQNTDQFGNLKVATTSATSFDDVVPDLTDLVETVFAQHGEDVKFSIDVAYGEVSAPGGDRVSHVLALPFITESLAMGESETSLQATLQRKLERVLQGRAAIVGPW